MHSWCKCNMAGRWATKTPSDHSHIAALCLHPAYPVVLDADKEQCLKQAAKEAIKECKLHSMPAVPVKTKSSFQITSVTVSSSRLSNDGGEDSADDLDESHTDDNSRVTDNETPSFSEDTMSKDEAFYNAGMTSQPPTTAPVIPTSAEYGLAIVPEEAKESTCAIERNAEVRLATSRHLDDISGPRNETPRPDITDVSPDKTTPADTPVPTRPVRHERFKVVKIESDEPFRRGRWTCMDYLDHSVHMPVTSPFPSCCPWASPRPSVSTIAQPTPHGKTPQQTSTRGAPPAKQPQVVGPPASAYRQQPFAQQQPFVSQQQSYATSLAGGQFQNVRPRYVDASTNQAARCGRHPQTPITAAVSYSPYSQSQTYVGPPVTVQYAPSTSQSASVAAQRPPTNVSAPRPSAVSISSTTPYATQASQAQPQRPTYACAVSSPATQASIPSPAIGSCVSTASQPSVGAIGAPSRSTIPATAANSDHAPTRYVATVSPTYPDGKPIALATSVNSTGIVTSVSTGHTSIVTTEEDSSNTANTVAIDNKIEQAMDLVKSHLMFAVREEVEVLKEKIAELMDRINQLEYENGLLKTHASPETLAQVSALQAAMSGTPSAALRPTAQSTVVSGAGTGQQPPQQQ